MATSTRDGMRQLSSDDFIKKHHLKACAIGPTSMCPFCPTPLVLDVCQLALHICVHWPYIYVPIGSTCLRPLNLHICVHWPYMLVSLAVHVMCPLVLHMCPLYVYVSIGSTHMGSFFLTLSVLTFPQTYDPVLAPLGRIS